jgi:hypothetical protein
MRFRPAGIKLWNVRRAHCLSAAGTFDTRQRAAGWQRVSTYGLFNCSLGADLKTTQGSINVTDTELWNVMNEKLWKDDRPAAPPDCQQIVSRSA